MNPAVAALLRGLACLFLLAGAAVAAPPSPQLVARDYFGPGGNAPQPRALRISRLEVETALVGGTAQTSVTARFENPTSRPLEGEFTLDLPVGSVVTGYALDIGQRMVDGVITPRRQAMCAYEARVRRGVDPGVAEVTRTNAFRTRVFPIFPGNGRTVRLSFATPVDAGAAFVLPLETDEAVGEVVVRVRTEAAGAPAVQAPERLRLERRPSPDGAVMEGRASNLRLSGALRVGPFTPTAPITFSRHASGDFFLDIADRVESPRSSAAESVGRVRVYWDRSRSRRNDDLEAELRLLSRYLAAARPEAVDLVTFADGGPEVRRFDRPEAGEVEAALRPLNYTGATSLQGVFAADLPPADACLLFSDGTVSVDPYRAEALPCPVLAVSSAPDADRGLLSALAAASGGEHIDLRTATGDAALARLTAREARVAAVVDDAGADLQAAILPAGRSRFRLVARAPDDGGGVTVRFADGSRRSYPGAAVAGRRHDAPGALWASARLQALNATDRPDGSALLRTARRFGVPASGLTYIVLETPYDYAQAEIEPPASLGADGLNTYRQFAANLAEQQRQERAGRLQRVLDAWTEHKRWWRDPEARRRAQQQAALYPPPPPPPPPPAVEAPPPPPPSPASAPEAAGGSETVQDVVVTGSRTRRNPTDAPAPLVQLDREETATDASAGEPGRTPDPDRPYLRALEAAPSERFAAVLREQERRHGDLPAFYFDVAEWLHARGRTSEARAFVGNALESPAADVRTLAVLAARLERYGDFDRAIWAHERVLLLEPDRPQPRRNLALALIARAERPAASAAARRADYARAVELLSEVVLTPWDRGYDGIGLISLTEANRVIPALRRLGGNTTLDPRLIDLLDVDLRVTLDWSTEATDLNLSVQEPGGEQAQPGLQVTAAGGRVSNDIAAGYGPEEYQIRRAPPGGYAVRVNTLRTDRLDPNGPIAVRARVFRNWGRPSETVEEMPVELRPGQGTPDLVVGFEVGAARGGRR